MTTKVDLISFHMIIFVMFMCALIMSGLIIIISVLILIMQHLGKKFGSTHLNKNVNIIHNF